MLGYAGDEILIAPAFTSTDQELAMIIERFTETMAHMTSKIEKKLGGAAASRQ